MGASIRKRILGAEAKTVHREVKGNVRETKQVMCSAVAYCLLAAHSYSPLLANSPSFIIQHDTIWHGLSVAVSVSCTASVHSQLLAGTAV